VDLATERRLEKAGRAMRRHTNEAQYGNERDAVAARKAAKRFRKEQRRLKKAA